MLLSAEIENFSLIERSEISFKPGFNVMTGESGAGKTLVLKAIRFALGGRAARSLVGQWGEKTRVMLRIKIKQPELIERFGQEEVWIDHEMSQAKRSVRVNQRLIALAELQALSKLLILDCQQSSEQALKEPVQQQYLVDQLINPAVLLEFNQQLKCLTQLMGTRDQLHESLKKKDEVETMIYHADELSSALEDGNKVNELMDTVSKARQYQQLSDKMQQLDEHLRLGDRKLAGLLGEDELLGEETTTQGINLQEAISSMRAQLDYHLEKQQVYAMEAAQATDKLSNLQDLARKHHIHVSELGMFCDQLYKQIENIKRGIEDFPAIEKEIEQQKKMLSTAADALYLERSQAAKVLSKQLSDAMALLGMPNASCQIQVHQPVYQENGGQMVNMMLKTDADDAFSDIMHRLSGGELSRLSLLAHVLCSTQPIIFLDEVDTGLSGDAAKKVRYFLVNLAKKSQLLAISHLAAVAAGASCHFLVSKSYQQSYVCSQIRRLSKEEIVDEISRMLGGSKTKISRAHANEFLRDAEPA